MAEKVNPEFRHSLYRFIHKPIRTADQKVGRQFLERYTLAYQRQFERAFEVMDKLIDLWDPAKTPQPQLLKDIVGFTTELSSITNGISDADLRKLIQLAVPLWKQKGREIGYRTIVRLFTGKNSRTFNWFDFRFIVGEQSLAQEELGEDSWIISEVGVAGSNPAGNVVLLLPFEQNLVDRSINAREAIAHGDVYFFDTGPVTGSDHYLYLAGTGAVRVPKSAKYDLSGSFTLEMFVKTDISQDAVLFRQSDGSKEVRLTYNSATNSISYVLNDGSTTVTETLASAEDLDDNTWRHVALIVDRSVTTARLFVEGSEFTAGADISALGNLSMNADIWVGSETVATGRFQGGIDNVRLSLSAQYSVGMTPLPVPPNTFTEYQEEQLDEYFTDIRIVDNGDLDRTLVKRILNLMRPPSERLRIVYIEFFENFQFGKGAFTSLVLGSSVNTSQAVLVMPAGSVEVADTPNSGVYQDMVLQVRAQVTAGDTFGLRFLIQDSSNYYSFEIDVVSQELKLFKVVSGVATQIGTTETMELHPDTFYIFGVLTDFNAALGQTLIKTFVDGNLVHKVVDAEFSQGNWGMESFAGTTAQVSHVEMFTTPLETDTIKPNDKF